jgi:lysophospholipase L1-like esterase
MRRILSLVVVACVGTITSTSTNAQSPPKAELAPNVRIAVVGDSITEQKLYSRFIASYLAACYPDLNAHVVQFGWGGERATGFAARMENDLLPFKPNVVTLCYGMNDGSYTTFTPQIGAAYELPMNQIVSKLKAAGVTVVVGSPGAVDDYFFRRDAKDTVTAGSKMYNPTLAKLRDIAKATAEKAGMPFANVHDAMIDAMRKAQASDKLGSGYNVCGADGFHPGENGQLIMAFAFLRGLKLDGDLGTIAIDLKGDSSATNGHTIVSKSGNSVTVESKRVPFAFTGDSKGNGTRSILPYLPFNEEFNRLTLKVANATAEKLKVTWGSESKVFSSEQLSKGVNVAAEFEKHPLASRFFAIDAAVGKQQNFQTFMIKQVITNHRGLAELAIGDAELAKGLAVVRERLWAKDADHQAAVRAVVGKAPIKHTITVENVP